MPRLPGGPKTGGRKKGSVNKTTLERAAAIQAEARARDQKTGVDVMRDVMNRYLGMAAKYQPLIEGGAPNPNHDEKKYLAFLRVAGDFGDKLAPYETPRLQSTTLRSDTPEQPIEVKLTIVRKQLTRAPDGVYVPAPS